MWCWRRLFRVSWTARKSNQSILKEISPEYSLEGLMLKLKLQFFGHLMWRTDSLEKTLMLGKIEGRRRTWQRTRLLDGITDSMDRVWAGSGIFWWTERPGMLQFMGSQKVVHYWATELNWTELTSLIVNLLKYFIWQSGLIITSVDKKQITPKFSSSRQQTFIISLIFWGLKTFFWK